MHHTNSRPWGGPGDAARPAGARLGAGLVAVLATWGLYFTLLWPRMLFERSDGLWAGWRTVWADWAAHFAYANVFAYQAAPDWFSSHPLFLARPFDYPFAVDALSGLLMRVGVDRVAAFVGPSLLASLAFVALLFVFYAIRLGSSRLALLATTLFFTNGGLGFLQGLPLREYTYLPRHHVEWINVVSAELLPQRALLFGIPLALWVLTLLCRWSGRGFAGVSLPKLAGLGLLASAILVVHPHSWLALAVLCAFLLAFDLGHWRSWLAFAVATAVPSLILLGVFYGQTGERGFLDWHPGWLAHPAEGGGTPLWLFLWLNWGVFLPLTVVSVARFRYDRDPLVVAGLALFAVCFLVRFQPNTWDNTKLLTWAHLLLCVPVARYLAHLVSKPRILSRLVAVLLLVFVTASGGLDLWRLTRTREVAVRMWTRDELELAAAFRARSRPEAIVLCSDDHHQWVASLSGRRVLLGYRGWLASYGIDYAQVLTDVRTMLAGGSRAEALMSRYGVDYVVIGPIERRDFGAVEGYFERNHELVLQGAGHKVFRVSRRAGAAAS